MILFRAAIVATSIVLGFVAIAACRPNRAPVAPPDLGVGPVSKPVAPVVVAIPSGSGKYALEIFQEGKVLRIIERGRVMWTSISPDARKAEWKGDELQIASAESRYSMTTDGKRWRRMK